MSHLRTRELLAEKNDRSIRRPASVHPNGVSRRPLPSALAAAMLRRIQTSRDSVTAADIIALQRTVGNRALRRGAGILQRAPSKTGQTPQAQRPPPGGTIAQGGALNDATITAVRAALKQATPKRYIAYQDLVKVGGTLAWRANNPGNLRDAPTKIALTRGAVGTFAVFATIEEGRAAQKDLYLKTYGDKTVRAAVAKLTPPEENDTEKYLKDLQAQGINLDATVKSQIDQIMEAIKKNEGLKAGTEVPHSPDPNTPSP
jgi:hypothetical protein